MPEFPQSDHAVTEREFGRLLTGKQSEADIQIASHSQTYASHLLGLQGLQQTQPK